MNDTTQKNDDHSDVMRLADIDQASLRSLLSAYGLRLRITADGADIPGSFWGDEEAGLVRDELLARADTPLHSILHETCHYICMDRDRRDGLDTDAGGDYDEENAVCYLQLLLADYIDSFGQERMFHDMDCWGYTFRFGSAKAWFERDADDALAWLVEHRLVNDQQQPNWKLREY